MILNILFLFSIAFAQPNPGLINLANQGAIEINRPEIYSRVIAVGDIAGQYTRFFNLLVSTKLMSPDGVWMGEKSLMIITGNIIGSGPMNITVIDLLMNLTRQAELAGGKIIVLLGTEELKLLSKPYDYKNPSLERELNLRRMNLQQLTSPLQPRGIFLRSLPLAAKVGLWVFMNTGYFPSVLWPQFKSTAVSLMQRSLYNHDLLVGPTSIFSLGDWWKDLERRSIIKQRLALNELYGVVFGGADVTFNSPGEIAVSDEQRFIKVNTGIPLECGSKLGKILVFMSPQQMSVMGPAKVVSIAPGFIIKPLN